jgi:hypothetical protein
MLLLKIIQNFIVKNDLRKEEKMPHSTFHQCRRSKLFATGTDESAFPPLALAEGEKNEATGETSCVSASLTAAQLPGSVRMRQAVKSTCMPRM